MRLIDADQFEVLSWNAQGHRGDYSCGYDDGVQYVVKKIDDSPTIDAIPVEWLDDKFMDLQNIDKALSRAAWLVLHAWQKEQEANHENPT